MTSKKRKHVEPCSSLIEAMDMDDCEDDEVILKYVMVLNILVTYFDEGIFKWPDLIRDFYHHLGRNAK